MEEATGLPPAAPAAAAATGSKRSRPAQEKPPAAAASSVPPPARIDRVLFLGTGSAVPVPGQRNMSSVAVLLSTGAAIMIDCGEGTQHHLRVSTLLRASRLEAVLLTHLHGDHCFGLFGMLHTAAMEGRKEPVLIVGPVGVREMVETVLRCSGGWFPEDSFPLEFLEIPNSGAGSEDLVGPGGKGFDPERCRRAEPVTIGVRAGLTIQAVPLVHSVPDWGYVLKEPDRPGMLDATKALQLGVPARSPLLGKLKKGQAVTLESGVTVTPEEVLGPPQLGRKVAFLQDTCDAAAAIEPCRGAACVVHEATFEEAMEQEALSKGHSTSAMAADFASACGAHRLVLTHFSARYSTSTSSSEAASAAAAAGRDPAEMLGEEARKRLGPGGPPVTVAQDFMVLRGDRDFEPEATLAMKRPPWFRHFGHHVASVGASSGVPLSLAPCCSG